jgi:hypothetical protein
MRKKDQDFHGATKQPGYGESTSRSRKTLVGVMQEINRSNRWEERVWCLMAFTATVVLGLSLWI